MDLVLEWINNNYSLTALILFGLFLLAIIVFLIVIVKLNKVTRKYKALLKGSEGSNLEQLLMSNAKTLDQVLLKLDIVDDRLKDVEKTAAKSIQYVGLVRYNAFQDMGGDFSYSLALLDQKGDGVVISSIFGREDARTYAKPIKAGRSDYQLSEEEKQAIQKILQENCS